MIFDEASFINRKNVSFSVIEFITSNKLFINLYAKRLKALYLLDLIATSDDYHTSVHIHDVEETEI